ncbi:hypothetical protein D3C71_76970 [compost metagenome]
MPHVEELAVWTEDLSPHRVHQSPPEYIIELWFNAVKQLREHQGLAQEMSKLPAWVDCGLAKPILPLPESEEEAELHLYTKFPELATAMDMMVQWNKEELLGVYGTPRDEISTLSNVKLSRLYEMGVTLYVGPDDDDGRLIALDMGTFYA